MNLIPCLLLMPMLVLSSLAHADEDFLIRDCDGRLTRPMGNQEPNCKKWFIEWRSPRTGTTWGMLDGKTRQSVIEQRDRTIRFEKSYAKFFHTTFDENFSNPSPPLCDACQDSDVARRWTSKTDRQFLEKAKGTFEEWRSMVEESMTTFLDAVEKKNPFKGASDVLKEYGRTLKHALTKYEEIQKSLTTAEESMPGMSWLASFTANDFAKAASNIDKAFEALPEKGKDFLIGGAEEVEAVSIQGNWVSCAIHTLSSCMDPAYDVISVTQSGNTISTTISNDGVLNGFAGTREGNLIHGYVANKTCGDNCCIVIWEETTLTISEDGQAITGYYVESPQNHPQCGIRYEGGYKHSATFRRVDKYGNISAGIAR